MKESCGEILGPRRQLQLLLQLGPFKQEAQKLCSGQKSGLFTNAAFCHSLGSVQVTKYYRQGLIFFHPLVQ